MVVSEEQTKQGEPTGRVLRRVIARVDLGPDFGIRIDYCLLHLVEEEPHAP